MRYLFQRIVHNDHKWRRPSAGTLASIFDKGYVAEQGFAHEDWNFSRALARNGDAYGYCYYMPKNPAGPFSIAFATYEGSGIWSLGGLYENASYDAAGASFHKTVLRQRSLEIAALQKAGHIGGEYKDCTENIAFQMLSDAQQHYRWRIKQEHIIQLDFAVTLPTNLLPTVVGYHFSRPTELTQKQYMGIKGCIREFIDAPTKVDFEDGGDIEFPEGARTQKR